MKKLILKKLFRIIFISFSVQIYVFRLKTFNFEPKNIVLKQLI